MAARSHSDDGHEIGRHPEAAAQLRAGRAAALARRAGAADPLPEPAVKRRRAPLRAAAQASRQRTADGTPVDIAIGAIDFELRCIERASAFDFGGEMRLFICSAENLIVMKVFANRVLHSPSPALLAPWRLPVAAIDVVTRVLYIAP
jgi:hypothetical protein